MKEVHKMKKKDVLKLNDAELDSKVKIQGTEFDRKRRYSDNTLKKMRKLYKKGNSFSEIAQKIGASVAIVRYNVDDEYRKRFNQKRSGKHTGLDMVTRENRIQYKRELVSKGKIKI